MRKEPVFEWNEEIGQAYCVITDKKDRVFVGTATCHPDDADMKSRRTGEEIAFRRARIESMRAVRSDLQNELDALNQLYYSMKQSTRFNPKSYENIMLQRRIRATTFDLDTIKEMLATERENLRNLIQEKDKFYNQIRAHRNKVNSIQEN